MRRLFLPLLLAPVLALAAVVAVPSAAHAATLQPVDIGFDTVVPAPGTSWSPSFIGPAPVINVQGYSITGARLTVISFGGSQVGFQIAFPSTMNVGDRVTLDITFTTNDGDTFSFTNNTTLPYGVPMAYTPGGNPAISGSRHFGGGGMTVAVSAADFSPPGGTLSYLWRDADTSESLSTDKTFVPSLGDIGRNVYATVTAHVPGATDVSVDSQSSGAIAKGTFSALYHPSVPAVAIVGHPLTASVGTISPVPESTDVQWYSQNADGTDAAAIPDAAALAFTPGADLAGKTLFVRTTAHLAGYTDYPDGSNPTAAVALDEFPTPPAPVLSGSGVVGTRFSVDPGTWADSFRYRWFAADHGQTVGSEIHGATASTLPVTTELIGKSVYVEVTGHRTGFNDQVIGTALSAIVAEPRVVTTDTERVTVGHDATLHVEGLLPDTDYAIELRSIPVSLGSAHTDALGRSTTTVTIPANTEPGTHRLVVLLDGDEVASVSITVDAAAPEPVIESVTAATRDALASTGVEIVTPVLGSAALASAGILLLVLARRRRSPRH